MTNREDIISMAREAWNAAGEGWVIEQWFHDRESALTRFAALVAAAEREAMMQLFTDPENQPTQHGTVTVEYIQREIAAEREACALLSEEYVCGNKASIEQDFIAESIAADIRARGETK